MKTIAEQLQYKKGSWYIKTFSKSPDYFVAMANTVGYPESLFDFIEHLAWLDSGSTPLEACERLEKRMEMV